MMTKATQDEGLSIQYDETAVIAEIGRVFGSSLDISEVYERFTAEAKKLIPFDRLIVHQIIPRENSITIAYVSWCDIPGCRPGEKMSLSGTFSEVIPHTKKSLLINVESVEELTARFPEITTLGTVSTGMRSIICVPIISRGEVIGILHFRSRRPNAYTERELRLAEKIGAQIAGAIANVQLFNALEKAGEAQRRNRENAERLVEEISVIAEIGRLISSTLEIENVYESFASLAQKLIPFDRLSVDLNNHNEQTFTVTYVSGCDIPGRRPGDTVSLAGTISENILFTRTGLLISKASAEEIARRFPYMTNVASVRSGMRSMISVPLIFRDEVIGTLHFRSKKTSAYTEPDLRLAEKIGMQIAGAIANARLYSDLKRVEEQLEEHQIHLETIVKERIAELEDKNITLQELNTTLKVLLNQRDVDKKDMEDRFVMNIKTLVLPFVEQMKKGHLDVGQNPCLDIIETNLNHIATPLLRNIRQFNLTPREIRLAALVKDGKSTKEICEILRIATGTIDSHRKNIRKKLGLGRRKANLQSFLKTFDQ